MKILMIIVGLLILGVVVFLALPQFGRLPRGERRAKIEALPTFSDGQLHNRIAAPAFTGGKGVWGMIGRMLIEKKPAYTRPSAPVPALKPDLLNINPARDVLVWLGHSSSFLQVDGRRVLVDPVFCTSAPVNFVNKPFEGTQVVSPDDMPDIDYLVISHDHWDHLDYQTVRRLKERVGTVICPLGVGEHFQRWGFAPNRIVELEWGGEAELEGGFKAYCLESRHFSGRKFKRNQTLWGLFVLETPSRLIFLGGDGGYGAHYAAAGEKFGGIDLALIECGQYNENWANTHMFPEQTVQAARDLRAARFVAVHNSKFALSRHPWNEPLERVSEEAERLASGVSAAPSHGTAVGETELAASVGAELLTPMIGEVVDLHDPNQRFGKWWR